MTKNSNKILIYDGTCRVCIVATASVKKRDKKKQFALIDMHSEEGQALQAKYNINAEKSAFVIEDGILKEKSDMALYVLENLGWFEKLVARTGRAVPKKAADSIYSFVARHRNIFNR
ncbi:MAG: DUF393 domain-containing protein [Candidatus Pacebacteria bacterium]|nr:DUF393 domain-containing protein [Candidatus Paceibacterota bacterium]